MGNPIQFAPLDLVRLVTGKTTKELDSHPDVVVDGSRVGTINTDHPSALHGTIRKLFNATSNAKEGNLHDRLAEVADLSGVAMRRINAQVRAFENQDKKCADLEKLSKKERTKGGLAFLGGIGAAVGLGILFYKVAFILCIPAVAASIFGGAQVSDHFDNKAESIETKRQDRINDFKTGLLATAAKEAQGLGRRFGREAIR